ncbi:MAG TPA: DUF5682 family protein [Ilumatobacteraceae bacterium]|jgi:hypothetical protein|nr:hypothetical protein [Ilumatobacteraceae bacterium]MBP9053624.1 hypothetical protein [Ilumatobacteraceae bacterium]HQY84578.1 DUF5682 family protein [Ilumatobacteraceae bacterium]HRA84510.1 DUF5682 family protein [Ilumatobacteraceae bacterium]
MVAVHLLGIRHHGPGSARSVVRALDALLPTVVLVELPADCEAALAWVGHRQLVPPVALLGYVVDQPHRAAFLPFGEFSPEWQAFVWAAAHGVPVRAMDLPLANSLAASSRSDGGELQLAEHPVGDPLAALAAAAGDPDPERWWDDVIEHRGDGTPAFDAVAEAMAAVRGGWEAASVGEARREAFMRHTLRKAIAEGHERVAVVCGAWHVPALSQPLPSAAVDARTLRGLPRVKVGVSWVPWTHRRLASATGYGAGVRSPGWYAHVFRHPGPAGISRWFVSAARLLRARGLSASPDHLIAATRTAGALAALRQRPRPGLDEVLDAADTVMAGTAGLALIDRELIVGDAIGEVPDDAPQVPLARDLAAQQRRVRLQPTADAKSIELDVRTPNGRNRSVLLHRMRALGVSWGVVEQGRGSSGTFRETWALRWEPELTIRVIELSAHGTTVAAAAAHCLLERAGEATALADLVHVLDLALLADLPEVVQPVVTRVEAHAAHDPDVVQVIDTLGPLARALRYGDVRGTDAAALRRVFDGLVIRVLAGALMACRSLDDDAAAAMVERLAGVQAALALTDHQARRGEWPAVLTLIAERSDVHGLVQGRAARLLHDGGAWGRAQVGNRVSRALSTGTPPAVGASFVEGFVAGSGTVLVHDRDLLDVIDAWVSSLAPDSFVATVPLLRRTFGGFEPAERRQLGMLLAHLAPAAGVGFGSGVDAARAAAAMVTVRQLLGVAE